MSSLNKEENNLIARKNSICRFVGFPNFPFHKKIITRSRGQKYGFKVQTEMKSSQKDIILSLDGLKKGGGMRLW